MRERLDYQLGRKASLRLWAGLAALGGVIGFSSGAFAQSRLNEVQTQAGLQQTQRLTLTRVDGQRVVRVETNPGSGTGWVDRGPCPPVSQTLANYNFDAQVPGIQIVLQAGMAQGEAAAAQYVLTAGDFPLEVNQIDVIVGSIASVDTVMQYRLRVYSGPPSAGDVVYDVISSPFDQDDPNFDPADIPAIKVPATPIVGQASAIQLQFAVDQTSDPADRIFLNNSSGANSFTVSFEIVKHHNQIGNGCAGASQIPSSSNCFPATEAGTCCNSALSFGNNNWLLAIDCGGLACPAGWSRFNDLLAGICFGGSCIDGCRPSGDWLIRAVWTKDPCDPSQIGACCLPNGSCVSNISGANCSSQNGDFQGEGTSCGSTSCPQPLGRCCITFDGTCQLVAQADCIGGTWSQGTCDTPCPVPVGACCNQSGGCTNNISRTQCQSFGGSFAGGGTTCGAGNSCPVGACCMPSGMCFGSISGPQCSAQGGTFQGVGSLCDSVSCPQPAGACCTLTGSCEIADQALCEFFGGTFQGGGVACDPFPCNTTGACCIATSCSIQTFANCFNSGGSYLGDFSGCLGNSSNPITCCGANFDQLNGVQVADIFSYLNAWFSQFNQCAAACTADYDGVGGVQVADIFAFLAAWFAGCN